MSTTFGSYGLPTRGAVAVSVAGQEIFPVFNNRASFTPEACETDSCNEHGTKFCIRILLIMCFVFYAYFVALILKRVNEFDTLCLYKIDKCSLYKIDKLSFPTYRMIIKHL